MALEEFSTKEQTIKKKVLDEIIADLELSRHIEAIRLTAEPIKPAMQKVEADLPSSYEKQKPKRKWNFFGKFRRKKKDIPLEGALKYAQDLGYTQKEIQTAFHKRLPKKLEENKYNSFAYHEYKLFRNLAAGTLACALFFSSLGIYDFVSTNKNLNKLKNTSSALIKNYNDLTFDVSNFRIPSQFREDAKRKLNEYTPEQKQIIDNYKKINRRSEWSLGYLLAGSVFSLFGIAVLAEALKNRRIVKELQ